MPVAWLFTPCWMKPSRCARFLFCFFKRSTPKKAGGRWLSLPASL
jgi:hypothetical protein